MPDEPPLTDAEIIERIRILRSPAYGLVDPMARPISTIHQDALRELEFLASTRNLKP